MKKRKEKRVTFNQYWLFPAFCLVLFTTSCSDDGDGPADDNFDRGELLENMATNLIIPNFEDLQGSVNGLTTATDGFIQATNEANLELVQNAWVQAVTDFQHCSAFGFGPGSLSLGPFASVLGVFPVDETELEQNIIDSNFNLAASFSTDIRGFYAIEYLIYGTSGDNAAVVAGFDQDRKDYLQLIMGELKSTIDNIVAEWNGDYFSEFTTNAGTSAGSPITLLYNEFIKDYENLKNFKVELPAGLTAGQTATEPTKVEAFYSGISTSLIEEQFENSKNIWSGRTQTGEDFVGFEEYLNAVVGGPELVETTTAALNGIDDSIDALPSGRLSENVGATELQTLRDLLQANTANFKSSMSSLLGLAITFNSGDGD